MTLPSHTGCTLYANKLTVIRGRLWEKKRFKSRNDHSHHMVTGVIVTLLFSFTYFIWKLL